MSLPSFKAIKDIVLCEFYNHEMRAQEGDVIQDSNLNHIYPRAIGYSIFNKSLTSLIEEEFVNKNFSWEQNESSYEITVSGLNYIDHHLRGFEADGEDIRLYLEDRKKWHEQYPSLRENTYRESDQVPASDRTVTLDHNSDPYKEATEALDKAIEEFREDHRLDNDLGHEKGALLKALEGGRELLNDTEVNVRMATALLLEPLMRIADKFGSFVDENKAAIVNGAVSGATATAAVAAIELIKALLGLG